MKPAIKYGLIGFALAVILFILIPGGTDNATTNLINDPATVQQESIETTETSTDEEKEPVETEPVIEVEESVDWSTITIKQKTDTLEYSKKTTNPLKLISCSDKSVSIDTDDELNLRHTGKQTITYTLSKDGQTKKIKLKFRVKDTKKPKIFFHYKEPKITAGDSFDPRDNIASVKDPVDGKLKYTSKDEPGKGEYTINGYYDTDQKGTYELKVVAKDKNGKVKKRSFKLKVKSPVVVTTNVSSGTYDSPAVNSGTDYILNMNTHKFHYPWCYSVDQMAEHNKWYVTMTRQEVINMGYSPCGNCNP